MRPAFLRMTSHNLIMRSQAKKCGAKRTFVKWMMNSLDLEYDPPSGTIGSAECRRQQIGDR